MAEQPRPFADAWYGEEILAGVAPLSAVFLLTAVALALTDRTINGVLERHPELRLGPLGDYAFVGGEPAGQPGLFSDNIAFLLRRQ